MAALGQSLLTAEPVDNNARWRQHQTTMALDNGSTNDSKVSRICLRSRQLVAEEVENKKAQTRGENNKRRHIAHPHPMQPGTLHHSFYLCFSRIKFIFLSLLFPDQTYSNILFSGNDCEWLKMDRDVRWCSYCFYLCFLSDKIYSYILFLGNMFSVSGVFTNHKQRKTEKYTNVLGFECWWSVFPGTSQIWYS